MHRFSFEQEVSRFQWTPIEKLKTVIAQLATLSAEPAAHAAAAAVINPSVNIRFQGETYCELVLRGLASWLDGKGFKCHKLLRAQNCPPALLFIP